jgi:hypothetical protein
MGRFILRYRGEGDIPSAERKRIESSSAVKVIDKSSGRMMLVEGAEDALKSLIGSAGNWVMAQEQTIHLPRPHPNLAEPEPKPPR